MNKKDSLLERPRTKEETRTRVLLAQFCAGTLSKICDSITEEQARAIVTLTNSGVSSEDQVSIMRKNGYISEQDLDIELTIEQQHQVLKLSKLVFEKGGLSADEAVQHPDMVMCYEKAFGKDVCRLFFENT